MLGYLGIDQYGTHYNIKKYPRKELCERLGVTSATKMYTDTTSGEAQHIGYVINDLWIELYEVHEFTGTKLTKR